MHLSYLSHLRDKNSTIAAQHKGFHLEQLYTSATISALSFHQVLIVHYKEKTKEDREQRDKAYIKTKTKKWDK